MGAKRKYSKCRHLVALHGLCLGCGSKLKIEAYRTAGKKKLYEITNE